MVANSVIKEMSSSIPMAVSSESEVTAVQTGLSSGSAYAPRHGPDSAVRFEATRPPLFIFLKFELLLL
jgi:hypothetical protein